MFVISQTSDSTRTKVASVSSTLTPPFNPFSTTEKYWLRAFICIPKPASPLYSECLIAPLVFFLTQWLVSYGISMVRFLGDSQYQPVLKQHFLSNPFDWGDTKYPQTHPPTPVKDRSTKQSFAVATFRIVVLPFLLLKLVVG